MAHPTQPFLAIYVVWHPSFADGDLLAEEIRAHFRRELYENVAGGSGLSVMFRSDVAPGSLVPIPVKFDEAETTAVVVLADDHLVNDPEWVEYVRKIGASAHTAGLGALMLPVTCAAGVLGTLNVDEQALRMHEWPETDAARLTRLKTELAYEFCRMLRHYLEHLKHPADDDTELEKYLKKVQIFLSHSKRDPYGAAIALAIRDHLHAGHGFDSFFDVHDIPGGLKFQRVILHRVRTSAVVAIHTDSFSSREWCRKEILEAKRANVPLVVANSVTDIDERSFPYMGNVPNIRLDPGSAARFGVVIGRLMDEVLKDFLWRCQVQLVGAHNPAVFFLPRPPELVSLASLPAISKVPHPVVVYPDPPLSADEERLFAEIAPHVALRTRTEWLAGVAP